MHNFKELSVWEKGRELVSEIYTITKLLPKPEQFGLSAQMRKAAVSIPSNIAEGSGRGSDKEFVRFLDIANGSSCELDTQLYLVFDQNYISKETLDLQIYNIQEIQKMLYQLKKHFNSQKI